LTDIRYLLDENMPHAVRDQLLLREPEMQVLVVGDEMAPALGTPDPMILEWIERNGYILISRNRRTIPKHLREHLAAGRHVPGIFLVRRRFSLGRLIDDLLLIRRASEPGEYQDRIEYLPL
jgi:hypothetical protein